ncbi:MAG: hypothetical protein Q9191_007360 [Dirinaria sp. TL-2023a]
MPNKQYIFCRRSQSFEDIRISGEDITQDRPALERSLSQATTIRSANHGPSPSNPVPPLGSFENPYPPGVAPPNFLDHITPPTNAVDASSRPDQEKPTANAKPPLARRKGCTEQVKDKLFPRVVESYVEKGKFVRKRQGQRSASAPQQPTPQHAITDPEAATEPLSLERETRLAECEYIFASAVDDHHVSGPLTRDTARQMPHEEQHSSDTGAEYRPYFVDVIQDHLRLWQKLAHSATIAGLQYVERREVRKTKKKLGLALLAKGVAQDRPYEQGRLATYAMTAGSTLAKRQRNTGQLQLSLSRLNLRQPRVKLQKD